jgi:hypothetical protein
MRITHIDEIITFCSEHLERSSGTGTIIESYLTQYLLVAMCAAFEEEIKKTILSRAAKARDRYLLAFVESCVGAIFRSARSSEIAGLLNRLSEDHKKDFQDRLSVNPRAETFFNNIVTNRHATAHRVSGSTITFKELVKFYEEGHIVLDAFSDVLLRRRRTRRAARSSRNLN